MSLAALAAGAAALQVDLHAIDPCAKPRPDEILICGSRDARSPYRLPKVEDEKYAPKKVHPENIVSGGRIHAESNGGREGIPDNRIMITFMKPF